MALYAFKNKTPEIDKTAYIAPSAQVIGQVSIGERSSIWFQSVVRGDLDRIQIGKDTNIQDLSVCHIDSGAPLTIGNGVTVGHGCVIHGCTIEDNCLIGMGAVVMNHARIETGSIIAAGAVVLENTVIPPYSLVTGSPAAVKKTYDNKAQMDRLLATISGSYVKKRAEYKDPDIFYRILDSQ